MRRFERRLPLPGIALALALGAAPGAARDAEPRPAPGARTARVRFVDAIPTGPSVEARLSEIQERIRQALVYPPIARRQGLEGVTRVRFEIRRDGEAEALEVAGSSGHWVLDRAAEQSVRRAAPLPWVYGRLEVPVRFELEAR